MPRVRQLLVVDFGTVACSLPTPIPAAGGGWWAAMTRVDDVSEEQADRRPAAWASDDL